MKPTDESALSYTPLLDGQHDCVYRLSWDMLAYQFGPENETRRQMDQIAASHGHGTLFEPVPAYVAIPKARLDAYAALEHASWSIYESRGDGDSFEYVDAGALVAMADALNALAALHATAAGEAI